MSFTKAERRFLMSARGQWVDLEGMRCPPHILQHILEGRVKMLGEIFEEFRSNNQPDPDGKVVSVELELEGLKLF
jgi:hypothetical protein